MLAAGDHAGLVHVFDLTKIVDDYGDQIFSITDKERLNSLFEQKTNGTLKEHSGIKFDYTRNNNLDEEMLVMRPIATHKYGQEVMSISW